VASRQEEKERRRQERIAAEEKAAAARSRSRRIQAGLAAVIVVAVVAGGVIALTGGSSGDKKPTASANTAGAKIPPAGEKDLTKAAAAAHCVVLNPPIEGRSHVTTPVHYGTDPPSSGNHNPIPALDGIYSPGNTPTPEHFVHTLEHGRVEVQYKPGTPKHRIDQLETLVSEPLHGKPAYKVLLFENNTNMSYAVAATAWGHILGCPTFTDKSFDAIRDFRLKYVDQGPEIIPPNN
jgi:hypothetical protein